MALDPGQLSSAQVCRRAGVTYRQLDYWTRTGYARPLVGAAGQGSQRRWTPHEADVIGHMASLRRAGYSLERSRELAEALQSGDSDRVMAALGLEHLAKAFEVVPARRRALEPVA